MQLFVAKGALFTASFLLCMRRTQACGGFFCQPRQPILQAGEAIAFGVSGTTVSMHVQILYEGPAEGFSWLLPMPVQPSFSTGSDVLFDALFKETVPTYVFNIDEFASTTCQDFNGPECFFSEGMEDSDAEASAGASVVLEEGNVGPFEYAVLDPDSGKVFDWLEENGYDQPEEAEPLIEYYARHGMIFVALRLSKESDTGEIQPLVLTYDMPSLDSNTPIACVPMKLTSIAATQNMPMYIYILGESRAVPLNYLDVELDDTQVDWLGCMGNPGCYYDDYRSRFSSAINTLENRTFITEYAGSARIMDGTVELSVSIDDLQASKTPAEFLLKLADAAVPAISIVTYILQQYIPPPYSCSDLYTPDTTWRIEQCFFSYGSGWTFDPVGLANELDEKVFKPAEDAQVWVDQYSYFTRMYGSLSPENMDKDPFFAFKSNLPDVSHIHTASGVPVCSISPFINPTELDITVDSGSSVTIPAQRSCGRWFSSQTEPTTIALSPALQLTVWNYDGANPVLVQRELSGEFDIDAVVEAVTFGDSLVMDQSLFAVSDTNATGVEASFAALSFAYDLKIIVIPVLSVYWLISSI